MAISAQIAALEPLLERLLRDEFAAGVSEFALIRRLQQLHPQQPAAFSLDDDLALFRCHFLLFHTLYRLRDRLRAQRTDDLLIGPLMIALQPWQPGEVALARPDPLRDYYLDRTQLRDTDAAAVRALLDQFWCALDGQHARAEALQTLGLDLNADAATVRRRYRELAMRHHPDRGGDTAQFQAIANAWQQLQPIDRRHPLR